MDVFEQYVRAGLELQGVEVDDVDLAVMRAAEDAYGEQMRALAGADLVDVWPEPDLAPGRAPGAREETGGAERGPQAPPPAAPQPVANPQDLSLRAQAAAIAAGELDPGELLEATLARIEERDGPINSIVARFPDEAERMLADAPAGPLHGVPIAVKDQFSLPWRAPTDGTSREALPASESGVYRRLRDAGATIPAVTNMHFWGGGTTGAISAYGPAGNPWNAAHCAGGSSGGSAAAVGARLVAGAVGADGGGSIRLPAAYCGVNGIKPTFGSVPTDGNVHGYLSVDVAGPFCRDAADTRLLAAVLTDRELAAGDGSALRAGIVRDPFWSDADPEVEAACRAALEESGWRLEDVTIEGVEHVLAATVLRVTLEGLPSLDKQDIEAADPIMRALTKYELLLPAPLVTRSDRVRALLRRSVADAFERVDLLVWPTVPAPAPPLDNPTVELPSGQVPVDAANVRQAGLGNLCGIPGLSTPVGLHSSGLPIGLMLLGRWGEDARVLDAAEHVEHATDRQYVDAVAPVAAPV